MSSAPPLGAALAGQRAVVMGLGQFGGGVAAARYLVRHRAQVCVTDLRPEAELRDSIASLAELPIRWVLGRHDPEDFASADLIVANPAVPPSAPLLRSARERGVTITSEMELFLRSAHGDLVLVSGTHGKSSTVTFLHQLLRGWRRPVFLGGNLGRPLLAEPAAHEPDALCVVEISSYQLEALPADAKTLRKARAVGLTALAPDHLERHGSLEAYYAAKRRLFALAAPGGRALLPSDCADEPGFRELPQRFPDLDWHTYGAAGSLRWDERAFTSAACTWPAPDPWKLGGAFQRHNVLLALGLAQALGLPPEVARAKLPHLSGLPHRMAHLPAPGGPLVIDNGVSTTPESTLAGLLDLPAPAHVLLGGQAKSGLDYAGLLRALAERGDRVYAFGAAASELVRRGAAEGLELIALPDLASAFEAAWSDCPAGRPLYFSPACASFDAYPNFQARAREFGDLVALRCSDMSLPES